MGTGPGNVYTLLQEQGLRIKNEKNGGRNGIKNEGSNGVENGGRNGMENGVGMEYKMGVGMGWKMGGRKCIQNQILKWRIGLACSDTLSTALVGRKTERWSNKKNRGKLPG